MSGSPVVTVIIPTYNHAHFLEDALHSLCMQSYCDWEAIIINNFSDDNTIDVVESFADPRIRLENFHNHGVIAASRNRGILLARGRYIAFLDSDDTWYPNKLALSIPHLDKGADLVCHGLRHIGSHKDAIYNCGPQRYATFDALLDRGCSITTSATLVRKSILVSVGGFSEDPEIVTAEDYHLWIRLAQARIKMVFMREILGEYRIHANSQSKAVLRHLNAVLQVIREFLPIDSSSELRSRMRYKRRIGLAYYSAGRGMQKHGQFADAWPLLFRAFIYRPFYMKNCAAIAINAFYASASKLMIYKRSI